MRIRRLTINNFRGIAELDWKVPDGRLVCLIGPGDSGKTTVLSAIDWLLTDRRYIAVELSDFNDLGRPIKISALITGVPNSLLSFDSLGLFQVGLDADCETHEAPTADLEPCLYFEFTVDDSLEPRWSVINSHSGHTREAGAYLRRKLGVYRIDDRSDHHLRWAKGSALSRCAKGADGSGAVATNMKSVIAAAVANADIPEEVSDAFEKIGSAAASFGSPKLDELRLGIDESGSGRESLALYSKNVPVSSYGRGTKRLIGMAAQKLSSDNKTSYLIDEIESGLEPYRVISLLELFSRDDGIDQVFMTSHSNVVVEYCSPDSLVLVRKDEDKVQVHQVPKEFNSLRRTNPSAFLAKRILVVEGETEQGLFMSLIPWWNERLRFSGKPSAAAYGSTVVLGKGGAQACNRAMRLCSLGYNVAILLDSDDATIDKKVGELPIDEGFVFRWPNKECAEAALISSLSLDLIQQLIFYVVEEGVAAESVVLGHLAAAGFALNDATSIETLDWSQYDLNTAREMVAKACTMKSRGKGKGRDEGWFKSVQGGIYLAEWLEQEEVHEAVAQTKFWNMMKKIANTFLYSD